MAPSDTWIQPATGYGYARDVCLAAFASGVARTSGFGYLTTGSYEPGDIYIFDSFNLTPTFISPATDPSPSPTFFGDWVYYALSGQLPTEQATGGLNFMGGAYGGANWVDIAYSGTYGLQIQSQYGGILGFDSAIPTLGYTVTGTEVFSAEFQVLDTIPNEIVIQLYDSTTSSWYGAYLGSPTENFGLTISYQGPIAPVIGQWQQITFTPTQVGLNIGDVLTGVAWGVWNSLTTSTVVFSDTTDLNSPSTTIIPSGYIDCVQDGITGYYILSHFGPLIHVPAIGAPPIYIPLSLTPSFAYTGLIYNSTKGFPYFIGYDGSIYEYSSGVVTEVTGSPAGVTTPARWLHTDQSNLYTMFSNNLDIGKYNISSSTWTVTGTPFTSTLDTFSYSASISGIIAAGSNSEAISVSGTILDMAYSSIGNGTISQLLILDNTPQLSIYNTTNGGFSLAQIVSGVTGAPVNIATPASGTQALVTDTTNNLVNIVNNVAGTWEYNTPSGPVSLTAPSALAVVTSGLITQALICQPSINIITVLTNSGTNWTSTQVLPVSGAISVATTVSGTTLSGIAATSNGVTFLNSNNSIWSVQSNLALSPAPTIVVADQVAAVQNGLFYGAATSGANIIVYIFQNSTLVGQYTITGKVLGTLTAVDWEIIVPAASGNLSLGYYINGVTNNISYPSTTPTNPVKALYFPTPLDYIPLLLLAGPHTIWSFYNDSPQSYTRITDSQVAILSGSSWTTIDVNNRNRVSSITTDPSGNIFAVSTDNYLYKWSSLGVLASGYPWILTPPLNQAQGVPIGASKLTWWNGQLYSASSLAGGIISIIP